MFDLISQTFKSAIQTANPQSIVSATATEHPVRSDLVLVDVDIRSSVPALHLPGIGIIRVDLVMGEESPTPEAPVFQIKVQTYSSKIQAEFDDSISSPSEPE